MESQMLYLLDFDFNIPTSAFFLEAYIEVMNANCKYALSDEFAYYNLELQAFNM